VSTRTVALLVCLAAFALYGLTTSQNLEGYEPETAAVTEGFVKTGDFVVLRNSPLRLGQGFPSDNGKLIGRAGLTDPLVRVPFYLAGWGADQLEDHSASWKWRERAFWFASPFYVAIGVAFFFLAALEVTRSRRWALALAGLFAVGSLAWPYSKIGMEGVLMTALLVMFYGVLRARRSPRLWPWALAGFGAGAALADKPYGLFAVVPLLALLIPTLRRATPPERLRRIAVLGLPLLAWGVAFALYNHTRTGSFFDTGRNSAELTLAAPLNFVGFFLSPGKGLVFFSPLVVVGALGLTALYRRDRRLAVAIVSAIVGAVSIVAALRFWSDESWGPRYIVWVAWLLLLPIPFWATTRRRRRILAAVAVVAVGVQFLGVVAPGTMIANAGADLTGQRLFTRPKPGEPILVPYGRDPVRWIPELSPLLLQAKVVASKASMGLGGPPITTTYRPYEGAAHSVRLDRTHLAKYGFGSPYLWWAQGGVGAFGVIGVALLLSAGAAATWLLVRVSRATAGVGSRASDAEA
jgi:hypothetical protein